MFCFAAGNTTRRNYGSKDHPFLKIGSGLLYEGIFSVVKNACVVAGSDRDIKKSIRDGLNTIRLHHNAVEARKQRKQQPQADDGGGAAESDSSLSQGDRQNEGQNNEADD